MAADIRWLTREDIGLIDPNRWSSLREVTRGIFFHHSGTVRPSKPMSVEASITQWKKIQLDHLSRLILDKDGNPQYWDDGTLKKWADIAYNIGIGYRCILDGRGLGVQGGGTGYPWDKFTLSICVLGNMTLEELDFNQIETIICALQRIRRLYGDDLTRQGDRDVNSTNCPGNNIYDNIEYLWKISTKLTEQDEDMGKPLHIIEPENDPYGAQFVRWDNGTVSHLGPGEIKVDAFRSLPHIVETDRPAYFRLVKQSGTQWRPADWHWPTDT